MPSASQVLPHPPQFEGSAVVSVQPFPHSVCEPRQGNWQVPAEHVWPAPHAAKQAPQLAGSLVVSRQLLLHAL
jgi:hypothetical protein